MDKVELVYKKMQYLDLNDNDSVIVAVSGGADSMSLLHLLIRLRSEKNFKIVCAHVHHNARKESDDELIFVREYCIKNNVIFETKKIEEKLKGNFENEARTFRYNFFEELIKKYHAKFLFTAHHGDDLIETILMRIVRGSNIKGYSGFTEVLEKDTYSLIRPLISVTKDQIVQYNNKHSLSWVEDYTNKEDIHTRNRYRKYILPKLKEEDKNVHEKFLKFSNNLIECYNYIDKIVDEEINKIYVSQELNIKKYKKLDPFIQKNIMYKITREYYNYKVDLLNDKHIQAIINLINSKNANGYVVLPSNVIAVKSYDKFYFEKRKKDDSYSMLLEEDVYLPNGMIITKELESDMTNNYICRLNSKEIKLPLIVRTRQDGDFMYIKNLNGQKKIKDIFINEKVKIRDRKVWPIVTDSENNIVWLPGIKKSKYDKQKSEFYDIILKYQKGGDNNE